MTAYADPRSWAPRRSWRWLAAFLAGRATDVSMTIVALSAGAFEVNPVGRTAWLEAGAVGLLLHQAVGICGILIVLRLMPAATRRVGWVVATVMSWLPVAFNVAVVAGLVR